MHTDKKVRRRVLVCLCLAILILPTASPSSSSDEARADSRAILHAGLRVIDGNGRDLGRFLSYDRAQASVMVYHERLPAHLWIDRATGSLVNNNASLVFEQPDCLGEPWARTSDNGRLQGPYGPNGKYFIVGSEADAQTVFVSRRQISGGCQNEVPISVQNAVYSRVKFYGVDEIGYEFPVALSVRIVGSPLRIRPHPAAE